MRPLEWDLPPRLVLDTCVFVRATGQRKKDQRTASCEQLWSAAAGHGCTLLVPAPVLAEVLRGGTPEDDPVFSNVVVVDFDRRAARRLGKAFSADFFKGQAAKGSDRDVALKYDGLIVAIAHANSASIATFDGEMIKLAGLANVTAKNPRDYRVQLVLDGQKLRSQPSPGAVRAQPQEGRR